MIDPKILGKNIITELELESLSDEKKIELVEAMAEVIQKRVILRIMELLGEEDKDAFEKVLDQPEEAAKFLQEKIKNLDEIVLEEIARFKEEVIEAAKAPELE